MIQPGNENRIQPAMLITLNGRNESLESEKTVAELLHKLALAPIRVAVEVNEDLVPRRAFDSTALREGDRVEIVTFVGGG